MGIDPIPPDRVSAEEWERINEDIRRRIFSAFGIPSRLLRSQQVEEKDPQLQELQNCLNDGWKILLLQIRDRYEELGEELMVKGYDWLIENERRPDWVGRYSEQSSYGFYGIVVEEGDRRSPEERWKARKNDPSRLPIIIEYWEMKGTDLAELYDKAARRIGQWLMDRERVRELLSQVQPMPM